MTRAALPCLVLAGCLSTPPPAASSIDAAPGDRDAMPDAAPDASIDGGLPAMITAITAGLDHVCVIDSDTRLFCWGSNRRGQLGRDSAITLRATSPVEVGGTGWTSIAAGNEHTCGVQGGVLLCWGDDTQGEAGDGGGPGHIDLPTSPDGSGTGWRSVTAGAGWSCGIRDDGASATHIYCWGNDYDEQLGDGVGNGTGPTIRAIATTSEGSTPDDWSVVTAGIYHTCAIRSGGELYCWGSNNGGELGDGTMTPRAVPTRVLADLDDGLSLYRAVAPGGIATCAIGLNGGLYCWGNNGYQQLGVPAFTQELVARRIGAATDWSSIAISYNSVCGSRADGVRCWGDGNHGELGNGDWSFENAPRLVDDITTAALVTLGYQSTCAAPTTGGVLCWGDDPEGELGLGETSTKHVPTLIAPADGTWTAISAGSVHTCGIHAGVVQCWGWNKDAAGGTPVSEGSLTPAAVPGIGAGTAVAIAASRVSSCALIDDTTDVSPWCWGYNSHGQIGNGPAGTIKAPIDVGTGTWSRLAATGTTACAITGTTRSCWGDGAGYGLGNNATTTVLTPTAADGSAWSEVSLGYQFGCGIQTSGALACWGIDASDQQGDGGGSTTAMTPHVILSGTSFSHVAAGADGDHACAISTVGADLYCWGRNDYAQCGLPGGTSISVPTLIDNGEWIAITAGPLHSCGIKNDGGSLGELWCWGNSSEDQIGIDADQSYYDAPMRIGTDTGWTAVSAGAWHTCGLRAGNLYCWGSNLHGQLGDGTHARPAPVAVTLP